MTGSADDSVEDAVEGVRKRERRDKENLRASTHLYTHQCPRAQYAALPPPTSSLSTRLRPVNMQRKPINSNSHPLAMLQPGSACLAFQVGYLSVKYRKGIMRTVATKWRLDPIRGKQLQAPSVSAIVLLGYLVAELLNSGMR